MNTYDFLEHMKELENEELTLDKEEGKRYAQMQLEKLKEDNTYEYYMYRIEQKGLPLHDEDYNLFYDVLIGDFND